MIPDTKKTTVEMSDSDSDFGDFSDASFDDFQTTQVQKEEEEDGLKQQQQQQQQQKPVSLDSCLEDLFGSENTDGFVSNASHDLNELISDERPNVIYEQLVLLSVALRPFSWKKSQLRSLLLRILQIDETPEPVNVVKQSEDKLFNELMNDYITTECESVMSKLGYYGPKNMDKKYDEESGLIDLLSLDMAQLPRDELENVHDQLCAAIDQTFKQLQTYKAHQTELLKDKATFEEVITNLVGHTQRLRRGEIATYNRKHKKKNLKRFSWVG